jgi:phosphoribosylformimino-5-aminoimidazole carboxamide ribotide isomerase
LQFILNLAANIKLMFRVILALDLMNGIAVHAIKGERHQYKPLKSQLCDSFDPLEIIAKLNPREVYIADLNKITGNGDNFEVIKAISKRCSAIVDLGIKNYQELIAAKKLIEAKLILGTETASLKLIQASAQLDVTVSIDIKQNKLLTSDPELPSSPVDAAKMISEAGIAELIVLNLDRVGTAAGIDLELLKQIKFQVSGKTKVIVGGGIRDEEDLKTLEKIGVNGAIVATAIYNGSIPRERLRY